MAPQRITNERREKIGVFTMARGYESSGGGQEMRSVIGATGHLNEVCTENQTGGYFGKVKDFGVHGDYP
jgi:hypothetical protein